MPLPVRTLSNDIARCVSARIAIDFLSFGSIELREIVKFDLDQIAKFGNTAYAVSEQLSQKSLARGISQEILEARLLWKAANHGLLSRIAREAGHSKPFVSEILRGTRTNKKVEALFARYGAPGFVNSGVAA
jgi:hypothetical protein